jgi:PKD repeat protein
LLPIVTVNPLSGCGPLSVTFNIDTTGTTGNGQSYSWNFGNGQTLNEAFTTKVVIYNQGIADTTYHATLTISNSCFSHTVIYPIMVNSLSNANFVMPHDWECSPAIVQFKNLTLDRNASYYWDFGDGTSSTSYQPNHSFTTGKVATEYMIKLIATNDCGKDSVSRPLLIKPNSIEAFIQMSARMVCPGEIVTFTNYSTDTLTKIMNYYWDFGDGTVSNTWNATHAYATGGKFTVKLFVDNGCSYAEKTDQIEVLTPLTLLINSRDSICLGDTLNLQGFSNSGALINTKWDFGDTFFDTGAKVSHLYTTSGWKNITFTAASASGISHCSSTAVKRVYVKDAPITLPINDIEGCAPVTLSLKNVGPNVQLWNFGEDNNWSSSGNYTYTNSNSDNKPLRKKVSIVTENSLGCQTVSFFWVTVYPNPVAKIGVRSEGGSPENVFVSSLSTNTTACQWLFPDGTSSQGCDSVLIRLFNNGFYKIQLRSSNQYGCTDTTSVIHQTIIKGLFVPNAFQPLNPSKEVNIFKPIGIGLQSYYLGVYDVWGNPIWETDKLINSQPAEGWNGQTNKGINLPMDAYIWRIKAVFIDGTSWKGMKGKDGVLRTEGTVTLIK